MNSEISSFYDCFVIYDIVKKSFQIGSKFGRSYLTVDRDSNWKNYSVISIHFYDQRWFY